MNFSGKLTTKVVMKKDYVRADGSCALYVQVFLNKERKRFPCDVAVKPEDFDEIKQRIKKSCKNHKDHNLIIEKMLGDFNKIEVNYRLSNVPLTLTKLIFEFKNPTSRMDFIVFWENEMKRQKETLKKATYDQQMCSLAKLKLFKESLYFYEITPDLLVDLRAFCKNKRGNKVNTTNTFLKNFKKYLHIAQKRGIVSPLLYSDISLKHAPAHRHYLSKDELLNLNTYFNDPYLKLYHKTVLAKFLFSCFTGLRYSDIEKLTPDNFIEDILVFSSEKTSKLQRIPLSKSAKSFAIKELLIDRKISNQNINEELKIICNMRGIKKKVSFHVARHTFATNFLFSGGKVEHLQKLLGHSDINETMIYVHIVDSMTETQIHSMDQLLVIPIK